MNNQLERIKRNQLISLINEVGNYFGEEKVFLEDYAKEQLLGCTDKIDLAIICFQYLKNQALKMQLHKPKSPVKKHYEKIKGRYGWKAY